MNKKQRNKKIVAQNARNRMFNRRYSSTIKTLNKLLKRTAGASNIAQSSEVMHTLKGNIMSILGKLNSALDKAVKKRVIHKNKAARTKSTANKLVKMTNK
jgi:ribosomal protein S20